MNDQLGMHQIHYHLLRKKYSQLEKETPGISFVIKKFHPYLYGKSSTIYTDHQPLKHVFNDSHPVPVMAFLHTQQWALTLGAYHYSIGYKPGRNHGILMVE